MWRHQASYPDSQWQAIELHASQSITSLISPPTKEDARKRNVILDRQVSAHSGMGGRNGRKKRPELAAQLHSEAWHCVRALRTYQWRDTHGSPGLAGGWCINSRASRPRTRPDADAPIHRCLRDKRRSQASPRPSPNAPEHEFFTYLLLYTMRVTRSFSIFKMTHIYLALL